MKLWPSKYNVHFRLQLPDDTEIYVLQNLFHGQVDFFSPPIPSLFKDLEHSTEIQVANEKKLGVLDRLIEKKFLYRSREEEVNLVQKYVDTEGQRDAIIAHQRGSQYCFLPTYACNLRCPYCFQREIADKGHFMNEEMVDLAFSAIDGLEKNATAQRDTLGGQMPVPGISIAGGEPLLTSIRQRRVLERIIQCSEDRGFRYSVVTNGVKLKDYVDMFDRTLMITDIQVTIDGPAWIHNIRRAFADGRGTFHLIERGVNAALDKRLPLSLRVNIDLENIDYVKDLGAFILDTGWLNAENFHCYVSPVTDNSSLGGYDRITDESLLLEKMLALRDSDPDIAKIFNINHFLGFNYVRKLVEEREPKLPVLYRCEAVLGMYIFDPRGNIYVCLEASGNPQFSVGSYVPKLELSDAKIDEWFTKDLVHLPTCSGCKVRFICAGGCAFKAFVEPDIPDCKPILKEMQLAWNHFREQVAKDILCNMESGN